MTISMDPMGALVVFLLALPLIALGVLYPTTLDLWTPYRGPYGPVACRDCREPVEEVNNDGFVQTAWCPGCYRWVRTRRFPLDPTLDLTSDIDRALYQDRDTQTEREDQINNRDTCT